MLKIKRVYERKARGDGKRVYIDRLWPWGLSKEEAAIDEWFREVTPRTDLRKWFGHRPDRYVDFKKNTFSSCLDRRTRPFSSALP
jgi:uncharacterized protein YeaO (DUF488 family)